MSRARKSKQRYVYALVFVISGEDELITVHCGLYAGVSAKGCPRRAASALPSQQRYREAAPRRSLTFTGSAVPGRLRPNWEPASGLRPPAPPPGRHRRSPTAVLPGGRRRALG